MKLLIVISVLALIASGKNTFFIKLLFEYNC